MTTTSTPVEVDAATTNIAATELNLVTFPGDHYLQVDKAGKYLCSYSFTGEIDSVAGGAQHVESGFMIDGVAVANRAIGHATFTALAQEDRLNGTTILTLTANQQVSLYIENTTSDGKVLTIDHLNIVVTQIGG
jgi:hypothetical protein